MGKGKPLEAKYSCLEGCSCPGEGRGHHLNKIINIQSTFYFVVIQPSCTFNTEQFSKLMSSISNSKMNLYDDLKLMQYIHCSTTGKQLNWHGQS